MKNLIVFIEFFLIFIYIYSFFCLLNISVNDNHREYLTTKIEIYELHKNNHIHFIKRC
jgi:hypothetical protein